MYGYAINPALIADVFLRNSRLFIRCFLYSNFYSTSQK